MRKGLHRLLSSVIVAAMLFDSLPFAALTAYAEEAESSPAPVQVVQKQSEPGSYSGDTTSTPMAENIAETGDAAKDTSGTVAPSSSKGSQTEADKPEVSSDSAENSKGSTALSDEKPVDGGAIESEKPDQQEKEDTAESSSASDVSEEENEATEPTDPEQKEVDPIKSKEDAAKGEEETEKEESSDEAAEDENEEEEKEDEEEPKEEDAFHPYYIKVRNNTKVFTDACLKSTLGYLNSGILQVTGPKVGNALPVRFGAPDNEGIYNIYNAFVKAEGYPEVKADGGEIPSVTFSQLVEIPSMTEEAAEDKQTEDEDEPVDAKPEEGEETKNEAVAPESVMIAATEIESSEAPATMGNHLFSAAGMMSFQSLDDDPNQDPSSGADTPAEPETVEKTYTIIGWPTAPAVIAEETKFTWSFSGTGEPDVRTEEGGTIILTWSGLPKFDELGEEISYTFTLPEFSGYTLTAAGVSYTYTRDVMEPITVSIEWQGELPESAQLQGSWNYAHDGEEAAIAANKFFASYGVEVSSTKENEGKTLTVTCTGLPKIDGYTYTYVPAQVDGFQCVPNGENKYLFRPNASIADPVSSTITWWDGLTAADRAPISYSLTATHIVGEGEEAASETIPVFTSGGTVDSAWAAAFGWNAPTVDGANDTTVITFRQLPKTDENGNAYTYAITSTVPAGYASKNSTGSVNPTFVKTEEAAREYTLIFDAYGLMDQSKVSADFSWNDHGTEDKITIKNGDETRTILADYGTGATISTTTASDKSQMKVTVSGLPVVDAGFSYSFEPVAINGGKWEKDENANVYRFVIDRLSTTYILKADTTGMPYPGTLAYDMTYTYTPADGSDPVTGVVDAAFIARYTGEGAAKAEVKETTDNEAHTLTIDYNNLPQGGFEYSFAPKEVPGGHWEKNGNTFTFVKDTVSQSLTVEYWDGHDAARPEEPAHQLYVTVTNPDGSTTRKLLVDTAAGTADDTFLPGYNWNVPTYSAADDTSTVSYSGLPEKDAAGKIYVYELVPVVPNGYDSAEVSRATTSGVNALMIKTCSFTVTKEWRDVDAESARPTQDQWVEDNLKNIYYEDDNHSYGLTKTDAPAAHGDYMFTGDDTWTLTVTTYGYTGPDTVSKPYVMETGAISKAPALGEYDTHHTNFYFENTNAAGKLYDHAISVSTISDSITITFNKVWEDDNAAPSERPNVTFTLYRTAKDEKMFDYMSPVSGYDSMNITSAEQNGNTWQVAYANGASLPRYDADGNEYVYILTEKLSGTNSGNYKLVNSEEQDIKYFTHDGRLFTDKGQLVETTTDKTIYNLRTGTVSAPFTKTWEAKAMQSMDAKVKFGLLRRLKPAAGEEGGSWEPLWTADENGKVANEAKELSFTAEYLSKSDNFGGLAQYDSDGKEYEYRVVETEISINGSTITPTSTDRPWFDVGDTIANENYTVIMEVGENGKITNRLQQNTILNITKHWTVMPEENATISVTIMRNGEPISAEELAAVKDQVTAPEGASAEIVGNQLQLTTTAIDQTFRVDGLPQYDANGAEYTYSFTEVGCPEGYHFWENNFNNYRNQATKQMTVNQTVTNMKDGEGASIHFVVDKKWNDDGDASMRRPVNFELYYVGPDGASNEKQTLPAGVTAQLSETNQWHLEFHYAISSIYTEGENKDDNRLNADNYQIREVSIGANGEYVVEDNVSVGGTEGGKTYNFRGVVTNGQVYKVSEVQDESNSAHFTLVNTRVGTMSIEITKHWNTGDMLKFPDEATARENQGLTAKFRLKRDGKYIDNNGNVLSDVQVSSGEGLFAMETYKYDPAKSSTTTSLKILDLPKYDETGRIFVYELEEAYLNTEEFKNYAIATPDYQIISSNTPGAYTVGTNHTGDKMEYSFTNTRTKNTNLSVNKLWRDDGTAKRPDIVFQLWQKSTNRADEKMVKDITWNTKDNSFLWHCDFGNFPLYDSQGYAYEYYVKEILSGGGSTSYQGYYYENDEVVDGKTNNNFSLNAAGKTTFEVMAAICGGWLPLMRW